MTAFCPHLCDSVIAKAGKKFAVVQHLLCKALAGLSRGVYSPGLGVTLAVSALCLVIKGGPDVLSFSSEEI